MTQLAKTDKNYTSWIEELSQRYKKSQIKAETHVNSEMLQFYWSLGHDIVTLHAESRWGDKILKSLSDDLRKALPGIKGLSETSAGYAKRFYILYNESFTNSPPSWGDFRRMRFGASLGDITNTSSTDSLTNRRRQCSLCKRHWRTGGAGMFCWISWIQTCTSDREKLSVTSRLHFLLR